jgi:hypothetical protein
MELHKIQTNGWELPTDQIADQSRRYASSKEMHSSACASKKDPSALVRRRGSNGSESPARHG